MAENNSNGIRFLLFSLGMSSIIFQVIILREFLSVVQGNELTIGIILASWMLITGLGSLAGKKSDRIKNKKNLIVLLQLVFAILPILSVLALRYFWFDFFLPGKMLNILEIIFASSVALLPFTFISGFLFTLFCSESKVKESISFNYFLETAGSVVGGVLISLVLIFIFDTIQIILLISLINFLALFIFTLKNYNKILSAILILLIIGNVILFTSDLDNKTKQWLFPNQKLLEQKETPYGNVVVTSIEKQINVYESGMLSATNQSEIQNEETVHFAMIQHQNPKKVLLIGGGIFGTVNEILKYDISNIDYLEQNKYLIEIDEKYTILQNFDDKLNRIYSTIIDEPLSYLNNVNAKYNVIIVNLPPPSTAQLNRFYTKEFFELAKTNLGKDGIISVRILPTANYVSKEAAELLSIIQNTMKSVFSHFIIITSNSNYFVASDRELSYNITSEIDLRNIETKYVNKFYLNEFSLMQRADFIAEALDSNAQINTNFKPVAFYSHINYFLSYFELNKTWIVISLIVIFGLILFRMKAIDFVMFSAGYALSLSEIIIIFSLQIIFGYVYQYIGIIIALFMLGMSLGAYVVSKNALLKSKNSIPIILITMCIFLLILPFILKGLNLINISEIIIHIVFAILSLFVSFLTGGLFALLSMQSKSNITKTAGNIYSADLFGSALGAILVSVFLLPLIGFEWSCFSGAGLVLVGMVLFYVRKNN